MTRRKKRAPAESPEDLQLFKELCDLIEKAGIETRVEKGNFQGGICVVDGDKEMLFINKKQPIEQRIALILGEMKKVDALDSDLSRQLLSKIDGRR